MSFVNDSLCEVAETDTRVSGESGLEEGLWIGAFLTCTSALHSHYTLSPPPLSPTLESHCRFLSTQRELSALATVPPSPPAAAASDKRFSSFRPETEEFHTKI